MAKTHFIELKRPDYKRVKVKGNQVLSEKLQKITSNFSSRQKRREVIVRTSLFELLRFLTRHIYTIYGSTPTDVCV